MSDPKFLVRKNSLFLEATVIGANIFQEKKKINPSSIHSFGSEIISVSESTERYAKAEYFKKSLKLAKEIGADYINPSENIKFDIDKKGYHLREIVNYFVRSENKPK